MKKIPKKTLKNLISKDEEKIEEKKETYYTNVYTLFLNMPSFKECNVTVNLNSIDEKDYAMLSVCYDHMYVGAINIKEFNLENTNNLPINNGTFNKVGKSFCPNVYYKGLFSGKKAYKMEPYKLEESKLKVTNGKKVDNFFLEDEGSDMKITYDGLNIRKIHNTVIDTINLYETNKVSIFIDNLEDYDVLLYTKRFIELFGEKYETINVVHSYTDDKSLIEYMQDFIGHTDINYIDISTTNDFNTIINQEELLIFTSINIARAFISYYDNNRVIVQCRKKKNKLSTKDINIISLIDESISCGQIQMLNSAAEIYKEFSVLLNISEYKQMFTTVKNKFGDGKVAIRCTDISVEEQIKVKKIISKIINEFGENLVILTSDNTEKFVKEELIDIDGNFEFVHFKDFDYSNISHYFSPFKLSYNDELISTLYSLGAKVYCNNIVGNLKNENTPLTEQLEFELIENVTMRKPNKFTRGIYVYSTKSVGDYIEYKVFYLGYEKCKYPMLVNTRAEVEVLQNDDYKYYSIPAINYKENFKTVRIKKESLENGDYIEFIYDRKPLNIILIHNAVKTYKFDDTIITLNREIYDSNNVLNRFTVEREREFEGIEKIKLFQDRRVKADDNAEALYNYCLNEKMDNCYFLIDRDVEDYGRLVELGFKVIEWGSKLHKILFPKCEVIFTSHVAARLYNPFANFSQEVAEKTSKTVFLQHGITFENHRYFLNNIKNPVDMMCVTSDVEYNLVREFTDYEHVIKTGFARHDRLVVEETKREIVYFPTWNRLVDVNKFEESEYYKRIVEVYKSAELNEFCKENNILLKVVFHMESEKYFDVNYEQSNVKTLSQNEIKFFELIRDNLVLITDVSSLMFDQAYLKKPIISYRPYDVHSFDTLIDEVAYNPQNIDQLIKTLEELNRNNWNNDAKFVEAANKLFAYNDANNSKRIIETFNSLKK